MSSEDICIRKAKAGTTAIKNGTKTPQEAEVGKFLNRLKPLNEGMYDELLTEYKAVMELYNKDNS
jgi:hypothetical protein